MNVIKSCTKLKKMTKQDDCFMNASPQERIASIWELTAELYSLKNKDCVEQRLQKNITNLIKNKKSTRREKDKLDVKYLRQIS